MKSSSLQLQKLEFHKKIREITWFDEIFAAAMIFLALENSSQWVTFLYFSKMVSLNFATCFRNFFHLSCLVELYLYLWHILPFYIESYWATKIIDIITWNLSLRIILTFSHCALCSRNIQNVKLRQHTVWKSSNLLPLRFYVKSNFWEFKRSKNVIFGHFRGSEFWF